MRKGTFVAVLTAALVGLMAGRSELCAQRQMSCRGTGTWPSAVTSTVWPSIRLLSAGLRTAPSGWNMPVSEKLRFLRLCSRLFRT